MSNRQPITFLGIVAAVVLLCGAPAAADPPLEPRPQLTKPAHIKLDGRFLRNVITVKFHDGLTARLRAGRISDLGTGDLAEAHAVLASVEAGTWQRTYSLPESKLTALQETAQRNLGRAVADPNLRFNLILPLGADPAEVIDAFNALDCVELALPIPKPVPPPLPPDFQPNQVYENGGPSGVSAEAVWADGTTGATIKIVDLEYSWNLNHLDLPTVAVLNTPVDPFNNNNHGTAVLGEVAGIDNGSGVTGIAHGAEFYVAGVWNGVVYDVGAAIITALGTVGPGDVIIIEQQAAGPAGAPFWVPVEWVQPWYDAIVIAVGNAVIVVEAAGNGGENLDHPSFSTGNFGHWPFLPGNDSGAIIVGAGAAPPGFGSDVDRSRLGFSTYGSTVDLQGWGEGVWTTGYGGAYSAEGVNLWYTAGFSGTSSASPIVAGAAALLQSAYKDATGGVLPPADIKQHLQETGWPQQSGTHPASQNIGPRPDAQLAILAAVPIVPPHDDCADALIQLAGTVGFSNVGATTDGPGELGLCSFAGDSQVQSDVWYRFVAQCTGQATVSLCGSGYDTKIAVYGASCPIGPGEVIVCNNDACGLQSEVTFAVVENTFYRLRIGGHQGAQGLGTMTITCTPGVPCPEDVNGDGAINVLDLIDLLLCFGHPGAPPCDAPDINEDGTVDVLDLVQLLLAFGTACP